MDSYWIIIIFCVSTAVWACSCSRAQLQDPPSVDTELTRTEQEMVHVMNRGSRTAGRRAADKSENGTGLSTAWSSGSGAASEATDGVHSGSSDGYNKSTAGNTLIINTGHSPTNDSAASTKEATSTDRPTANSPPSPDRHGESDDDIAYPRAHQTCYGTFFVLTVYDEDGCWGNVTVMSCLGRCLSEQVPRVVFNLYV